MPITNKTRRENCYEILENVEAGAFLIKPELDKKFKIKHLSLERKDFKVILDLLVNNDGENIFEDGSIIKINIESLSENEYLKWLLKNKQITEEQIKELKDED